MKKILTLIISLFIVISLALAFLYYPLLSNPKKMVTDLFKKGFIVESNNEEFKPFGDADKPGRFYKAWAYWSNSNPLKPVITYVTKENSNSNYYSYIQFTLSRDFVNYSVEQIIYANAKTDQLSEERVLEIAKKYDLSKENPDPNNIIVQTPPTKEEVQKQKDKDKLIEQQQNNKEYNEELNKCGKIREDEITKYFKIDPATNQIYISPETNYPFLDYNNYPEQIDSIMKERGDCEKQVNIKFGYSTN